MWLTGYSTPTFSLGSMTDLMGWMIDKQQGRDVCASLKGDTLYCGWSRLFAGHRYKHVEGQQRTSSRVWDSWISVCSFPFRTCLSWSLLHNNRHASCLPKRISSKLTSLILLLLLSLKHPASFGIAIIGAQPFWVRPCLPFKGLTLVVSDSMVVDFCFMNSRIRLRFI